MKKYRVTLNSKEGDFLVWGPPYWSQTVRAINADHAANVVALELYPRRSEFEGMVILAQHKSGERSYIRVGEIRG